MDIIEITVKGFFAGLAAIGFAILFNVPKRCLLPIWILGFVGGFIKYYALSNNLHIVSASFIAAIIIGILSVPIARKWYSPPLIFSIAAVIPMVPGAYAYNMMLGIVDLAIGNKVSKLDTIMSVSENGATMLLVLSSLAFGVALPTLISKHQALKQIEHYKQQ